MHTNSMKKLAAFLLTIFTLSTAAVCGCAEPNADVRKIKEPNVSIETTEDDEQQCPECPDGEKRDNGQCPTPRRPHKRHGKKLPRPKPAYTK